MTGPLGRVNPAFAVVGLLGSGGLSLLGLRNAWWSTTANQPGMPAVDVDVTGAAVLPGAVGLAIFVLAAGLGVLAGSPWVRRTVGGLVAAVAAGSVVWVVLAAGDRARELALDSSAVSGAVVDWHRSLFWQPVTALGFALAAIMGVLVVLRASAWASMSSRYDSPSRPTQASPQDAWEALDQGIDPTADEDE